LTIIIVSVVSPILLDILILLNKIIDERFVIFKVKFTIDFKFAHSWIYNGLE